MRASLKVACPLKTYLNPLTRLKVTIYVRGGLFSKEIFLTRAKLNCVESNPGLHWFGLPCSMSLVRELAPLSRPLIKKTKIDHDLVARVFSRFRRFACFYFEF